MTTLEQTIQSIANHVDSFSERVNRFSERVDEYSEDLKREKEENQRRREEDRRRMNKLESFFVGKWGKLVEALVNNQLVPLLQNRGIEIERTSQREKGCKNGRNYEFDIVAKNGQTIVVVEVKTTLRPADVDEFLDSLKHVREWISEYADKTVLGAMAFLHEDGHASKYAAKSGLFTILATGSSAKITNEESFAPKAF